MNATGQNTSFRSTLQTSLRWVAALLLAALAAWLSARQLRWQVLADTLASSSVGLLVLALATVLATTLGKAARWRVLLRACGTRVRFIRLLRLLFIGQMGNSFLPVRLGDVARVVLAAPATTGGIAAVAGTLVVEKALDGLAGLLVMAALALWTPLPAWARPAVLALALVTFALILLVALALIARGRTRLERLAIGRLPLNWQAAAARLCSDARLGLSVVRRPAVAAQALAWSAVVWVIAALTNAVTLAALGISVPAWALWLVLIAADLLTFLPTAPAQVGVFEYACLLALAAAGIGREAALAFALTLHVLVYLPPGLLGPVCTVVEGWHWSGLKSSRRIAVSSIALLALVTLSLASPAPAASLAEWSAADANDQPSPAGSQPSVVSQPWPATCPTSRRFGVAAVGADISPYDVGQLHAGWYHDFGLVGSPSHPAGLAFAETIRLSNDGPFDDRACSTCPAWTTLRSFVQANRGNLWLIGNEPDRIVVQDGVDPGRYAQLYHDFFIFLKWVDPTCKVGIGGVVQPTPLRLLYLDRILGAYQIQYGKVMPVDVWNVHNYVLNEDPDHHSADAGIPPGTEDQDVALHVSRTVYDNDNMGYFVQQIVQFRQWMADRGYRNYPLIVSEYGILMPDLYGFDSQRVQSFFLGSSGWLLEAADPGIGYPDDGNRLVQAWAWYSLNLVDRYDWWDPPARSWHNLFDPDTYTMTALGHAFGAYTAYMTSPSIDLQPASLVSSSARPDGKGWQITVTARVANLGTGMATDVRLRFMRDGAPAGEATIPAIAGGEMESASIVWSGLSLGQVLQAMVSIDPDHRLSECSTSNNTLTTTLLVADRQVYLPFVSRLP